MTVWTIQTAAAWHTLRTGGVLRGAPLPDPRTNYRDWCVAYAWMAAQLRRRGIRVPAGSGPCWAWSAHRLTSGSLKPDLRSSRLLPRGTRGVRSELRVRPEEVLLSQFLMWEYVLLGQYVALTRRELTAIERTKPNRAAVKASWQRIFDLDAGAPNMWEPRRRRPVQACLECFELDRVCRVDHFVAR